MGQYYPHTLLLLPTYSTGADKSFRSTAIAITSTSRNAPIKGVRILKPWPALKMSTIPSTMSIGSLLNHLSLDCITLMDWRFDHGKMHGFNRAR